MDTAQKAIDAALCGNWIEARRLNEQIIVTDPKNLAALNRLARALCELGRFKKAQSTYKKVLKFDPYNSIAQKAISRLGKIDQNGSNGKLKSIVPSQLANVNIFIEEPGKTKTTTLIHLGDPAIISTLDCGETVKLTPHAHRVSVETQSGMYIGRLTDDLSHLIIKLTRAGNEYQTIIRSASGEAVKIFIRETKRSPHLANQPSFPITDRPGYISFTSPNSIHDELPDVSTTEKIDVSTNR